MIGIIGIIAVMVILGLSLIITRLATVALTLTGLSEEAARFQARSAFTGTGFTTHEAESVVDHPVRRSIIMILMLLRSAGIISILLSLILSFMGTHEEARLARLGWLAGGVLGLWLVARSTVIDRFMKRIMRRAVQRWTDLDVKDYAGILKLSGDYVIGELQIRDDDWLAGKTLNDCDLRKEGVTVVGIYRPNGNYVGVPKSDSQIASGDTLVLYGRADGLRQLGERRQGGTGDRDHAKAVGDQKRHMERQNREEATS